MSSDAKKVKIMKFCIEDIRTSLKNINPNNKIEEVKKIDDHIVKCMEIIYPKNQIPQPR